MLGRKTVSQIVSTLEKMVEQLELHADTSRLLAANLSDRVGKLLAEKRVLSQEEERARSIAKKISNIVE